MNWKCHRVIWAHLAFPDILKFHGYILYCNDKYLEHAYGLIIYEIGFWICFETWETKYILHSYTNCRVLNDKFIRYSYVIIILDEASGNSKDWGFKGLGAKYSYVVELRDTGKYGFLLPEDQIIPTAEENYAAVLALAEFIFGNDP